MPCRGPCLAIVDVPRSLKRRRRSNGRASRGGTHAENAHADVVSRADGGDPAARRAGEDFLLDFARLACGSGLDLFPHRRQQWAKDTGQTVKTSFHNGDVPSQQRRFAPRLRRRQTRSSQTSPDPGSLVDVVKEARAAGIPVINFNTPDPKVNFNAYVGGDLTVVGRGWAQYLVDHNLVKSGDFVWLPVEVPGASYGVEEEKAIAAVFKPLNITWEVTDATLDQANVISRMSDYLTANPPEDQDRLGDMVTGSIKRVFDQVGVKPGEIPVVGWGNSRDTTAEVTDGYVNAAQWQDPQATSYMALSVGAMAAGGVRPASTSSSARCTINPTPAFTTRSCRANRRVRLGPCPPSGRANSPVGTRTLTPPKRASGWRSA